MYPNKKEEVQMFIIGLMDSLHDESTNQQIMKQLTDKQVPAPARLASVASSVITTMLMRVKQQGDGRKPHLQLILKSVKLVIKELVQMSLAAGIEITQQEQVEAARIAGDMIESGENASGQQGMIQEQQQPQQQGLIGGAMNG